MSDIIGDWIQESINKRRVRSLDKRLRELAGALESGQPISGTFDAALHEMTYELTYATYPPGRWRPPRWRAGRVRVSPSAVTWESRGLMANRVHDLSSGICTGDRQPDWPGLDIGLTRLHRYLAGSIQVLALRVGAEDIELAASTRALEILRSGLARVQGSPGGAMGA